MKKIISKHWPLIGIGVLVAVVSLYLLRAQEEEIQRPVVVEEALEEGIKLKDIHYTQDDPDEEVKWVLDAKEVRFSQDRRFFSFKDFKLRLEPENRAPFELEGKRGDYNKESGVINLKGDLHGYSEEGYTIFAEHLYYDNKKGVLTTNEPVRIVGPFFTITGRGLYFNLEEESFRMESGVTTTVDRKIFT